MTISLGIVTPSGNTGILTTDSPSSHYGIPVLRIGGIDYGPADALPLPRPASARGQSWNASFVVEKIGRLASPDTEIFRACQAFLRQCPGPQLGVQATVSNYEQEEK